MAYLMTGQRPKSSNETEFDEEPLEAAQLAAYALLRATARQAIIAAAADAVNGLGYQGDIPHLPPKGKPGRPGRPGGPVGDENPTGDGNKVRP